MNQKDELYIGIDISRTRAMVSLYHAGMKEPETISTVSGEEKYGIPTAIYIGKNGKYFYGEEALRRRELPEGEFFDDLYRRALKEAEGEEEERLYRGLFLRFLRRLIQLKDRFDFKGKEISVTVTLPKLDQPAVQLFLYVQKELEISWEHFHLCDYAESFYAHTYHQDPSLWQHDAAAFLFQDESISFYLLHRTFGSRVQMVAAQQREWQTPPYVCGDDSLKDEYFANIVREVFKKKMISSVYFVGDGFDGSWLSESLRVMGRNKRVFLGKNLFSRGACYVGFLQRKANWGFYFSGDYKMKGELSLEAEDHGSLCRLRLVEAGENYFLPTPEYKLIYGGTPQLTVRIAKIGQIQTITRQFELNDLPDRPDKTIRLRVRAIPESGSAVKLVLADDGFGELFDSTGKTWEYRIDFDGKGAR